jgi:hypothetical protein
MTIPHCSEKRDPLAAADHPRGVRPCSDCSPALARHLEWPRCKPTSITGLVIRLTRDRHRFRKGKSKTEEDPGSIPHSPIREAAGPQGEATTVAGPERGGLFCGGQRGLRCAARFAGMCVAPVTLTE